MIFFSVIIPTYNRSKLLVDTVNSVLLQNYLSFEVIIVDDGSTDDTRQVIKSNYSHNSQIKYYYKQNEERGAARNFGLKHAKGDYAVFVDSDDFLKPHYLQTLQEIISKHPDVKLLAAKYDYDNNGKSEHHPWLKTLAEGWYDQEFFLKGNILACNFAIKIKDHSFSYFLSERELASMEDWLFLLENLADNKIFIKDEVCVSMRQHDERSMNNNQQVIVARRKATNWALNKLKLTPSKKKTLKAWSHYFCGVHEYLDHKRGAAVNEVMKAIKEDGLNRTFLLLFVKSIAGRKLVKAIR